MRNRNAPGQQRLYVVPHLLAHSFPDGVVAYNPETKTTLYLPGPAGSLLTMLPKTPESAANSCAIFQSLAENGDPLAQEPEQLDALLHRLEELHLVVAAE